MLGVTPTRRAVARTPLRSARCPITSRALSSGKQQPNRGCPLPLGEAGLAGAAVEQPDGLGLAVVAADGQIAVSPLAVIGAMRVLAAEA